MRDFLLSNPGDVARHKAAHAGALYRAVQPSPNVDYNGQLTPSSRPRVLAENYAKHPEWSALSPR